MHKPNFPVTDKETDKVYWVSRAVAVVPVIMFRCDDNDWIPLGKRSPRMFSEPCKWSLPSGFIDWGESAQNAVVRETYEELNLYLPNYCEVPEQPIKVISEPNPAENDVISLRFLVMAHVDKLPTLKPCITENTHAKWVKVSDLGDYDIAYNQHEVILRTLYA